jgi:cytochrome c biogenesis protein CcmG/thiol:disulfide interchange protein DsbE
MGTPGGVRTTVDGEPLHQFLGAAHCATPCCCSAPVVSGMVAGSQRRRAPLIAGVVGIAALALVAVFATGPIGGRAPETSPIVGRVAPALTGRTLSGDEFDIDRERGRWVVVNFFATWCPPCVQEHPELVEFSQRVGDSAVVVSVAYDQNELDDVERFFAERGGDWPVIIDGGDGAALDYGVKKLPESFVVAPDGTVVAKVNGGVTADELERLIDDR